MKKLSPSERLIVAADNVDVVELAARLRDTGVCIKVNSALRERGYPLLLQIHELGLRSFADLKLNDIKETMAADGRLLAQVAPCMVTAMCSAGEAALRALKDWLPDAEVLGVTVLTSLDDEDSEKIYGCTVPQGVLRFARLAKSAGLDGVVASPREAWMLRRLLGEDMTINTPAIRPTWSLVAGDDQNAKRVATPADAIKMGADRIVVGRPIVQAADPREAVRKTLDEIELAVAERDHLRALDSEK